MSLEKIAKVLHVDQVELMHGPKGVAVRVRIDKSWHVSTIDNDDLAGHRREVIAEHLLHLADANIGKIRDSLCKSSSAFEAATQAALRADADAAARRSETLFPTWDSVGGFSDPRDSYQGIQQQVRRYEPSILDMAPSPQEPPSAPAVSDPMPSRFHAVMEELKNL